MEIFKTKQSFPRGTNVLSERQNLKYRWGQRKRSGKQLIGLNRPQWLLLYCVLLGHPSLPISGILPWQDSPTYPPAFFLCPLSTQKIAGLFQKCFILRELFQNTSQLSCSLFPVQIKHRQELYIWSPFSWWFIQTVGQRLSQLSWEKKAQNPLWQPRLSLSILKNRFWLNILSKDAQC